MMEEKDNHIENLHPIIPKHRRKTRDKKPPPVLDLNPMSDLAFQLIIFFMLATTFSKPQTMEIVMPVKPKGEDKEQAVKESKAMTLILHEDNKVYYYIGITDPQLEETNYSPEGLRSIVLEKNKEIPDLVILIKPSQASKYENLIDVLDEMAIAHTGRYAIVDITADDLALVSDFESSKEMEG